MKEGLRSEPAGLDAQSLRDMRDRAEDTLDTPVGNSPGGWWATHAYVEARDVVALTDEVSRLVGRVAEAERRQQEQARYLLDDEQVARLAAITAGRDAANYELDQARRSLDKRRVERDEARAALADARDALEQALTAKPAVDAVLHGNLDVAAPGTMEYLFQLERAAREVLVRLSQESDA